MAADMVRGLRAYKFNPVNDGSVFFNTWFFKDATCYVLALDSVSKNVRPLTYSPSVCCYGDSKEKALAEICKWMGSITSGMIQSPRGYIKPQKWVSAWEEALTNPNELCGMGWTYYEPGPYTTEEGWTSVPSAEIRRQVRLTTQFKAVDKGIMPDDSWWFFYNAILEIVQRKTRYTTEPNEIYLLLHFNDLIKSGDIVANFQVFITI